MYSETPAGRSRSFDDEPLERGRVKTTLKRFGRRRFPIRDAERGDWETLCRAVPLLERMFAGGAATGFARALAEAMSVAARLDISSTLDYALSLTDGLVDIWGGVQRAAVVGYVAVAYVKGADYYDVYLKWRDVPEVVDIARHAVNCFDMLESVCYDNNVNPVSMTNQEVSYYD